MSAAGHGFERIPRRLGRYWHGLSWETRTSAAIIALSALALAGFFAVASTGSSDAHGVAGTQAYVPVIRTTTKLVRVTKHGEVVIKRVPVVERIYARPVTLQETRTMQ